MSRSADRVGVALVGLQFVLIAAIALSPGGAFAPPAALLLGAGIATLLGAALLAWGALALGRNLTALPRPRPGAQLVDSGPFALVRHPIYVGLGMAALGYAFWSGSWLKLGFAAALCLLLIVKARYEGRMLRERMPGYDDYRPRALVPRARSARRR